MPHYWAAKGGKNSPTLMMIILAKMKKIYPPWTMITLKKNIGRKKYKNIQ